MENNIQVIAATRYNNVGQLIFRLKTNLSGSRPKRMSASCIMVRNSKRKSFRWRAISQIWSANRTMNKNIFHIIHERAPRLADFHLYNPNWRHSNKTREWRNFCSRCRAPGIFLRRVKIGLLHQANVLRTAMRMQNLLILTLRTFTPESFTSFHLYINDRRVPGLWWCKANIHRYSARPVNFARIKSSDITRTT